jgi:hypothetical protein
LVKVVRIGTSVMEVKAGINKYTKTANARDAKKSSQYIFLDALDME